MNDFTKPIARLGGINGVLLQRHIDGMRPAAQRDYTTPLYTVDQIIAYLEDQPYPMTEHGASIRALHDFKKMGYKLGASAQNERTLSPDTTTTAHMRPVDGEAEAAQNKESPGQS